MDLLYGIRILAVDYFLLSQSTHLTDSQTDRRTDRKATAIPCVCIRSRTVIMRPDRKLNPGPCPCNRSGPTGTVWSHAPRQDTLCDHTHRQYVYACFECFKCSSFLSSDVSAHVSMTDCPARCLNAFYFLFTLNTTEQNKMMMMMTVTMMIIPQVPQPIVLFKTAKYLYNHL